MLTGDQHGDVGVADDGARDRRASTSLLNQLRSWEPTTMTSALWWWAAVMIASPGSPTSPTTCGLGMSASLGNVACDLNRRVDWCVVDLRRG